MALRQLTPFVLDATCEDMALRQLTPLATTRPPFAIIGVILLTQWPPLTRLVMRQLHR